MEADLQPEELNLRVEVRIIRNEKERNISIFFFRDELNEYLFILIIFQLFRKFLLNNFLESL